MIFGALALVTALSAIFLTLAGPWWRAVSPLALLSALLALAVVAFFQTVVLNLEIAAGLSRRATQVTQIVVWVPIIEEATKSLFWRVPPAAGWTTPVGVGVSFGLLEGALVFTAAASASETPDGFRAVVELVIDPVSSLLFHALLGWATSRFLHLGRSAAVAIAVSLHAAHNGVIILNGLTTDRPELLVAVMTAALAVGAIWAARAGGPDVFTAKGSAAPVR